MARIETCRSAAIIASRPATCIGPIIAAARTAASLATPRPARIGRMCVVTMPWSSAISANEIAISQKAGRPAARNASLARGLELAVVTGASAVARPALNQKSGTAISATAAANTASATRQLATSASACALGNDSVPANPAKSETSTMARRARSPSAWVSSAKHGW